MSPKTLVYVYFLTDPSTKQAPDVVYRTDGARASTASRAVDEDR